MIDQDTEITSVVLRERPRLGNFIRRQVLDRADAEDILQDVFFEFVQVYRLSATVEQASAWLLRVARNRIIDRFRKKRERPVSAPTGSSDEGGDSDTYRLDLALPSPDGGPEAEYVRSRMLDALQQAIDQLPDNQREVFVAHELEGRSFKDLAAQSAVPVNTLLARKRYAVLNLRQRLQPIYDELDL